MSYRVAVHNAFEGLDDENEDPAQKVQVPRTIVEGKPEQKKEAPKQTQAKPAAGGAPAKKPQDEQKRKFDSKPANREGAAPTGQEVAGDKGVRRNTKDFQKDKEHDRNGRPPRNNEGRPPRGRQFDRKSGTGRPPTENKKGGAGSGNWGNELDEAVAAQTEEKPEGDKETPAAVAEDEAASPQARRVREEEKEPEVFTLDEFLSKQAQKAPKVDSLKLRSAGEGVSNEAWASYTPLTKEPESNTPPKKKAAAESKESKDKPTDSAENLLNFRINRDEGEQRGGGRGGRGGRGRGSQSGRGGRGGQGRGYGGGSPSSRGRSSESTFRMDDSAFPSLGGKAQ